MAEIGRSFSEINNLIKQMGAEIKKAKNEVSSLDKSLKLNPTNTDTVSKKIQLLEKSADLAAKRMAELKAKKTELDKTATENDKLNKEYVNLEKAIYKASNEMEGFKNQIDATNKAAATAKIDALNSKLEKTKTIASSVSKVLIGVVAALGAAVVGVVSIADELDDVSRKYQTTAEELQVQRNLFDKITESSDGYEQALKSLGSVMGSIAKGRGTAYLETFEKLGIAQEDLENKSNGEVYSLLFDKLQAITDETERATYAQVLMGDNGLNVALVAGTEADEIASLNAELEKNGIITSEEAAVAGAMADQWADIKLQFMQAAIVLMQALMPIIETLFNFIESNIMPALQNLFSWFNNLSDGSKKLIAGLILFLIVLPKLIAVTQGVAKVMGFLKLATYGQAAATGALSIATIPLQPILLAVAAALLVVITLIGVFSKSARDAASNALNFKDSLSDIAGEYSDIDSSMGLTATKYTETNAKTTTDVNVKVEATGDSVISEENAQLISEKVLEQIDTGLGDT